MIEKENHFWTKIDACALSEEEIGKKNLSKQEIFSIRHPNGPIHGPFLLSQVKDSLQKNPSWRNFTIRPHDKHYWIPLGEHPLFNQREEVRKNLLQSLNFQNNNIYLNIKGQTSGPYSFKEVEKKVLEKKLLPSDLINPDPSKQNWIRLFEVEYFNSAKKLPPKPQDELFERSTNTSKNFTPHLSKTDAIINLAQLEKKIKSNDTPLSSKQSEAPNYSQTIKDSWSKSSLTIIGMTLSTIILAISISFFKQKNPQRDSAKTVKSEKIVKPTKSAKKPFFVNKAKRTVRKPRIQPSVKKRPRSSFSAKSKPPKFFPVNNHSVLPEKIPSEPIYEEQETSYEPMELENEEREEEIINAIESQSNSQRNPSSSEDENEGLGEIDNPSENSKDNLFEEDIEFIQESSYDR